MIVAMISALIVHKMCSRVRVAPIIATTLLISCLFCIINANFQCTDTSNTQNPKQSVFTLEYSYTNDRLNKFWSSVLNTRNLQFERHLYLLKPTDAIKFTLNDETTPNVGDAILHQGKSKLSYTMYMKSASIYFNYTHNNTKIYAKEAIQDVSVQATTEIDKFNIENHLTDVKYTITEFGSGKVDDTSNNNWQQPSIGQFGVQIGSTLEQIALWKRTEKQTVSFKIRDDLTDSKSFHEQSQIVKYYKDAIIRVCAVRMYICASYICTRKQNMTLNFSKPNCVYNDNAIANINLSCNLIDIYVFFGSNDDIQFAYFISKCRFETFKST